MGIGKECGTKWSPGTRSKKTGEFQDLLVCQKCSPAARWQKGGHYDIKRIKGPGFKRR